MQNFKRGLLAAAVGLVVSAPVAAQFSGAFFFGDSVTDSGNYNSVLPPGTGKFTTNPGPIWPEVFARHFGLAAIPSTQGGTNYAYGGARVTQLPGVVDPPLSPNAAVPVATQVTQYLAKGPANPNAIYSINGGGNDFFVQFDLLAAGAATPAQVQAALGQAAVDLGKQAAILKAGGARYIMVWTVPDIGTIQYGAASGFGPTLTAASNAFNSTLFATLDALGVQGIRINAFALQNEVLKNPAAYGITNITGIACTTPSTVTIALCNASTLVSPNAPSAYFFADEDHPTTAVHQIFGDYAISFIEGPQQIAALPLAPFAVEAANFRSLDGRMWSSLDTPRTQKKLEAWAAYDYGSSDYAAGANNGSANTNTIVVGMDSKVNDHLLMGGMFGYTEDKGDFGGAGGGYKLRQPTATVYVGYGDGPWYVGGTMGAGSLDYSNIDRNIPLGPAIRTETGNTRGWEYTGRLLAGYWFKWNDVLHGPYGRLTYTKSEVHAYSESGSDSTALSFGAQSLEQVLWSLGWQVAGNIGTVRPFARATWEYDSKNQTPSVTASSVTLGGSYTVPGVEPDNNYMLFNLGASTDFGGITGYVMGSATAARGDGNYWAITVGIRAPL